VSISFFLFFFGLLLGFLLFWGVLLVVMLVMTDVMEG
jgi:hypothetical protein